MPAKNNGHLRKPFRLAELEAALTKQVLPEPAPAVRREIMITIPDDELRRAIEQDEFILHYQPQIDIATANVSGVEALVRWQHPERGLIFPDNFITRLACLQSRAERSGPVCR
jgi:predicted signal transduction protein with EAL and GGDEF domain